MQINLIINKACLLVRQTVLVVLKHIHGYIRGENVIWLTFSLFVVSTIMMFLIQNVDKKV